MSEKKGKFVVSPVRPPLKGRRLPALKALLDLPTVSWVEVSAAWYNGTTRTVELTSQTAVWYRSGKPPVAHPLGLG